MRKGCRRLSQSLIRRIYWLNAENNRKNAIAGKLWRGYKFRNTATQTERSRTDSVNHKSELTKHWLSNLRTQSEVVKRRKFSRVLEVKSSAAWQPPLKASQRSYLWTFVANAVADDLYVIWLWTHWIFQVGHTSFSVPVHRPSKWFVDTGYSQCYLKSAQNGMYPFGI